MRYRIYVAISVVLTILLAASALLHAPAWGILLLAGLLLCSILLSVRSVIRPLNAVQNGIYLLVSQDFNSRLRLTGQHDADRVATLFNRLMATMKAERLKLVEQNLFLSKLIEVSPMGIAVCDLDDCVRETNPVYRRMATPELEAILRSLAPEEVRVVRLSSSQIYRCSRLWFMDSGYKRTFFLIEELTADIIDSERKVFQTIIRTIGHEVGNTMGPVISVLESLAEMHTDSPYVDEAIRSSIQSCQNITDFVRGYSAVVKLPDPHPQPVNLASELHRLLPTLRSVAGPDIDISIEADTTDGPLLNLDMMLIERAIINIVKNSAESIHRTTNPGLIAISLSGPTLCITDNGIGISPEVASSLFTPFFSTKRTDRGLGLMLISDILRRHGATFSLTTSSYAPHLTTFAINFSSHSSAST